MPVLPLVVAAVLLILGIYFAVQGAGIFSATATGSATIAGIPCESSEHVEPAAKHIHLHLDIYYKGTAVNLPAQQGVNSKTASSCFYWIHTHDTSGLIHIEAPSRVANRLFTLGDAFDVWGLKLDTHNVGTLQVPKDGSLVAIINGNPYTGDPRKIGLNAHDEIVLEITPPAPSDPPTSYTFPAGV